MTGRKNKFIHGNLCEIYEMEKGRRYKKKKKFKLQAKVNKVFHSTVRKRNKAVLRNTQREVIEENSLSNTHIVQPTAVGEMMALR